MQPDLNKTGMILEAQPPGLLWAQNLWAMAWALLVLLALFGWGDLLARSLGLGKNGDWAATALLGFAFLLVLGGPMNALAIAGRGPALALSAVGMGAATLRLKSLWASIRSDWNWLTAGHRWQRLVLAFLLIRIGIGLYEEAAEPRFFVDDFHAYLAQVAKLDATGSLGRDPFSERRMSSLGGQPFALELMAAGAGLRHVRLMDGGVGLVLYLGLLSAWCRRVGAPPSVAILILTAAIFTAPVAINLTAGCGAAALFLLLLTQTADEETAPAWKRALVIGLLVAAIALLKSTFFVFDAAVAGLWLWRVRRRVSLVWVAPMMAAIVFLGMFAWMWASRTSNGTWFYPFTGPGWHASAFVAGTFGPWTLESLQHTLRDHSIGAVGLVGALWALHFRRAGPVGLFGGVAAASLGATALIEYATRGGYIRYAVPFLHAVAMLGICLLAATAQTSWRRWAVMIGLGAVVLVHALGEGRHLKFFAMTALGQPQRALIVPPAVARSYEAAQDVVPPGALILEHTSRSFLFDFRRNPIWLCDLPGGSSPPPGLALFLKDAQEMRRFLVGAGVRYVLFATRDRPLMPANLGPLDPQPNFHAGGSWSQNQLALTYQFQQRLFDLSTPLATVFDGDGLRVLDLGAGPR